jgi:signal transduction histidine kinase
MNNDQTFEILAVANTKIQKLLKPDRFYTVIFQPEKQTLSYPLVAEGENIFAGGQMPWQERAYQGNGVLPDQIVATGMSLSFEIDFARQMTDARLVYNLGEPDLASWLGVPLLSGAQAFGALIVEKKQASRAFGENGKKLLEMVAQHVALALQNTWLYQRLDRKLKYLSALNEIDQVISAHVQRDEPEILETIYKEASKLPLDTSTMYIAFYDAEQDIVTFPLVYENGKHIIDPSGDDWNPRHGGHRRTEAVIRNKKSILIRTKAEAKEWHQEIGRDYKDEVFPSWIGAPMRAGNEVLGMIAVCNTDEYKYDQEDLEVLEILASQTAVAILNFRLFNQKNNAEKLAMMSEISEEFVHRMNNLAGTIPVRAGQLRRKLNAQQVDDPKIFRDLDAIDKDAHQILDAARLIKEATANQFSRVKIDLDEAVETALGRAMATQTISQDLIRIKKDIPPDIPMIWAERYKFLDVLTNIIKNGLDAIASKGEGTLTISACVGAVKRRYALEISVTDTGIGISDTNLTRIFDLFFTTKPGGTGFGLWRDRFVIRELGGEIVVNSREGQGSTFKILVPVDEP